MIREPNGRTRAYTSNGIIVVNAKHICSAIERTTKKALVFDGEFFTKDWNGTQSLVMTQKVHPKAKTLCLRVFDILDYRDWLGFKSLPLKVRRARVDRYVAKIKSASITSVPFQMVDNNEKAILRFHSMMLASDFEGSMYKDPDSKYPYQRDKCWLRHKPKINTDCVVIGIKMGNKGKTGQMLGLIGSLQCKFFKEKTHQPITFNCSGMEMDERRKLTKMHQKGKLVGLIVEVEHEGITRLNKVRFPQFQRIRKDKDEPDYK